jgi:hypothetical protein
MRSSPSPTINPSLSKLTGILRLPRPRSFQHVRECSPFTASLLVAPQGRLTGASA